MSEQLWEEFHQEFWRSSGAMVFTRMGLRIMAARTEPIVTAQNPNPRLFIARGDPRVPGTVPDASWSLSEVQEAAGRDGWFRQWMSDAWIALMYARWEKYYRPGFAKAHDVDEKQVLCPVMGDIRMLRNDVIHHQGIATPKWTGRCIVLTRFAVGDRILLNEDDVLFLLRKLRVAVRATDQG